MTQDKARRIAAGLAMALDLTQTRWSRAAQQFAMAELLPYPWPSIETALHRCARELKFKLKLADILERIPGRAPTPEAAWEEAMRQRVGDEHASVVTFRAVFVAFPRALWAAGDRVAARMAFLDAYPAAVQDHGDEMMLSLGWDRGGHTEAIEKARVLGLPVPYSPERLIARGDDRPALPGLPERLAIEAPRDPQ